MTLRLRIISQSERLDQSQSFNFTSIINSPLMRDGSTDTAHLMMRRANRVVPPDTYHIVAFTLLVKYLLGTHQSRRRLLF